MTDLVDELANELRHYRHSDMASAALAEHIMAIPRIHDAQATIEALSERIAELKGAVIEAKLARLNWTKYNAVQSDEVVYQAEKMARAIDNIVASLTPDLSQ